MDFFQVIMRVVLRKTFGNASPNLKTSAPGHMKGYGNVSTRLWSGGQEPIIHPTDIYYVT